MSTVKPYAFTSADAADWAANQWIDYKQPRLAQAKKDKILPVTKYNVVATTFNISTVLLVVAVANAAILAFSAAFTLGSIGLFLRLVSEREINRYASPPEPTNAHMFKKMIGLADKAEREIEISAQIGIALPQGWSENAVFVFDFAVWKNTLPVPK